MTNTRAVLYSLLLLCCGSRGVAGRVQDQPNQAYTDGRSTVIGTTDGGGSVSVTQPDSNGCVEIVNGACIKAERTGPYCTGATSGPVDVIAVDGDSKVSVCYPSPDDSKNPVSVTDPAQVVDVAKTANGTSIVFDAALDGKPIAGPITLSANNVSLYGNGPDKTIIDGDLIIEKNGARVRGVRVKGNLIVKFNDVSIVLTQVDGNLTSDKNNGLFAANTVFGNMTISGSGHQLYYNNVQGVLSAAGASDCENNIAFTDANADQVLAGSEKGTDISCQ